ncbi:hypothetical protein Nepgr_023567 [Nepenthes gracilis]|uniref:WRKY domain-containing protein n=1 Tax=Nepenthes gracilis TaxID=150966 RepID=A0AAD3T1H2_NEPGR|nr:hypothetical protein Nepgr_023567 [Nepenthes gracilis]
MDQEAPQLPPPPPSPLSPNGSSATLLMRSSPSSSSSTSIDYSALLKHRPIHPFLTQIDVLENDGVDWASLLSSTGRPTTTAAAAPIMDHDCAQRLIIPDQILSSVARNGVLAEEDDKSPREQKRKACRSRKARRPRFAFQTRSSDEVLDDGFRWRKYGQKAVKGSIHPRSYYRCAHVTCNVKKQVQRLCSDAGIVETTYEGVHNHPTEKLMETLTPLLHQIQFLSRSAQLFN